MNEIKIPKSFDFFGQKITVEWVDYLPDCYGKTNYGANKITLQRLSEINGPPMPDDKLTVIFWHEVCHYIFNEIKKEDLEEDEALVHTMANLICQILKTAEY